MTLNRAVAVGMANGPAAALPLADALATNGRERAQLLAEAARFPSPGPPETEP